MIALTSKLPEWKFKNGHVDQKLYSYSMRSVRHYNISKIMLASGTMTQCENGSVTYPLFHMIIILNTYIMLLEIIHE